MQQKLAIANQQRLDCSICNYRVDPKDESAFYPFPCSIRSLMDETFQVWRCPSCQTIHCREVVDLDYYYSKYPFAEAQLVLPLRFFYRNLTRQLTKHGFSKENSLLDYGCGISGLLVKYLQQRGFTHSYGYDPYAPQDKFGDRAVIERQFDYISLQDVIEHVEDPHELLSKLDSLLSPGGYILIGTPNAANIDLNRPNLADHYNCIHVPYHLHLYTREILESLGKGQGWEPVDFFDRKYDDTPLFALNNRAVNTYMSLFDGSMDVLVEPLQVGKALTSPKFLFYALFGYWLSFHSGMSVMFGKSN